MTENLTANLQLIQYQAKRELQLLVIVLKNSQKILILQ